MRAIEEILDEIEESDLRGYVGERAMEFARRREHLLGEMRELCEARPHDAASYRDRIVEIVNTTGRLRAEAAREQLLLRQACEEMENHWRHLKSFTGAESFPANRVFDRTA